MYCLHVINVVKYVGVKDHMRRYHFENTPCGNCLCFDGDGVGLGCVCHLCDKMEEDNFSDVSIDEDRLAELERLANVSED